MEERYMEEQKKCCCHHGGEISDVEARVRTRTDEEYKKLFNRLNRIEGQIRGVKSMLEMMPIAQTSCSKCRRSMRHSTASTDSSLLNISGPVLQTI